MVSNSAFRGEVVGRKLVPLEEMVTFFRGCEMNGNCLAITASLSTSIPFDLPPENPHLDSWSRNPTTDTAQEHSQPPHTWKIYERNWMLTLSFEMPYTLQKRFHVSMFLGDWRAFKELVIKRSCVKAVCRSSTWRWYRVPVIVQKSSDDHLGCIKELVNVETKYYHIIWWLPVNPCKSWDKLPTSG